MASRLNASARLLLFLAFVAVVSLVLAEVGVRLALGHRSWEAWRRASLRYEYEPRYHWSLRPGRYETPNAVIDVNELGLRGAPVGPKRPGVLRVVALGGSSTFNYHASEGRTWPVRLGEYLSAQLGQEVEVINAGTPGYSTYQSSMRFVHQLVALEPDLVVVYHLWNDMKLFSMTDPESMVAKWDRHGRSVARSTALDPDPWLDPVTEVSQFATYARFAWLDFRKRQLQLGDEGWVHERLDQRVTTEGVGFYRANLERIVEACEKRGIPVVLVQQVLLAAADSPPEHREKIQYELLGFGHDELLRGIGLALDVQRELAERPGVHFVSTDAFPKSTDLMRDHVHFQDAGLAALVDVIGPPILSVVRRSEAAAADGADGDRSHPAPANP